MDKPEVYWTVADEIAVARGVPGEIYTDAAWFDAMRRRVFARSWHLIDVLDPALEAGSVWPVTLSPGLLDVPLLVSVDAAGALRCLSNVCTHRANLLLKTPARCRVLRCGYHGRRFGLDGRCLSMPAFDGVPDFPGADDDLPELASVFWGRWLFASLDPRHPLSDRLSPFASRLDLYDPAALQAEAPTCYQVPAHWALYCENYLEGFHIPYVHPGLNATLDAAAYRTECHPGAILQVGVAAEGEIAFDLPETHPDYGQRIAAYYLYLFPNVMLNFYPWGVSLNLVHPQRVDQTEVLFQSLVFDPSLREQGSGSGLHQVELEDEAVVTAVQRGVASPLYRRCRYSPTQEQGVHHFHRLLTEALRVSAQ